MADHVRQAVRTQIQVLESDEGDTYAMRGTSGSIRFVADKSVAPFALIHTRGGPDAPVLPHLHKHAIDTWLVLRGKIQNWAGEEGRVMCAGDFAFVPNGIVHSFQVIEPHTEFLGVIHPSEWIEFFRVLSDPWKGPGAYPEAKGHINPADFMKAIADGHDVVPKPATKFPDALHEWSDSEIPTEPKAYWLKAHRNKRYALGGQTLSPLCDWTVSRSLFSMAWLEGSKNMPHPERLSWYTFERHCYIFYVTDGAWKVEIADDNSPVVLQCGDSIYVPPARRFRISAVKAFSRCLVTSDGPGLEVIFKAAGKEIQSVLGEGYEEDNRTSAGETATLLKEPAQKYNFALG